jgi:hypothetical protein
MALGVGSAEQKKPQLTYCFKCAALATLCHHYIRSFFLDPEEC